jgi:prefoldin subunit 5
MTDKTNNLPPLIEESINKQNDRKIPQMLFIESIEEYVNKYTAEKLLQDLNVYYSKYKYMEAQVSKHSEGIKQKIPDIENAKESVEFILKKQGEKIDLQYMVSNNLYGKAEVPVEKTVCLWLGSGVMCEYSFEEALKLLTNNYDNAFTTLKNNESDLDFIKDQITTCEVSKFFL